MPKKSTLLSVSIFVLLFIGLSDYGYGCHKGDGVQHGQKPCNDGGDSGNNSTPVVVTFDDLSTDSIQSDDANTSDITPAPYVDGVDVQAIIPDDGHPPGQFLMNLKLGGSRNLFIDFGLAGSCNDDGTTDCVEDDRDVDVECPFPAGLDVRANQDGTSNESACSALVKATLAEEAAFDLDDDGVMENIEYILDMNPDPDNNQNTSPPVRKVRSVTNGEWDIKFKVPRPNGNKLTIWNFTFSNQDGTCPAEDGFPEFLSIRALDVVNEVGGVFEADTWKIGTFIEDPDNPAGGINTPRLACLIKQKGDEFIGFFSMSFMYTIVIK